MTTVITRAYGDEQSAKGISGRLYRQGFPRHHISVISADGESAAEIEDRMKRFMVPESVAGTYAKHVADGASLVVVRATYKPLGAVRLANETFETSGALDIGIAEQQFRVPTPVDKAPSVLKDHPRFLTMSPQSGPKVGLVTENIGIPLLSERKARNSVIPGGKMIMGGKVKTGRKANSAIAGGKFMSRAFWPAPLLSARKGGLSVIPGGGHPFSRLFGWPTTID
ncbi:hypothetical protein N9C96_02425 [bacterium]|nr:hypothetical protein [bacterium]